jgi:hypothetical protein
VSLPPVTAVVLAVALAGCLWLALRPPRWLLPDRHARRLGVAMATALAVGFVLVSRMGLGGVGGWDGGLMSYLLAAPLVVVLPGSLAAAAVGRSFRTGLWACAWAVALGRAVAHRRLAGRGAALVRQVGGLLLDGEGGIGVGGNLGDAIWWTLLLLALWAVPLGVLGAAGGSAGARRLRRGPGRR